MRSVIKVDVARVERGRSSRSGNPCKVLVTVDGIRLRTAPDASVGYAISDSMRGPWIVVLDSRGRVINVEVTA